MSPEPQPQPINLGGVGDLDMFPTETHQAVREIYQAGRAFGRRWPGLRSAIDADEQLVNTGFDDLSIAFRNQYNPYKEAVAPMADKVEQIFTGLGNAGNTIVGRYMELSNQTQPAWIRSVE